MNLKSVISVLLLVLSSMAYLQAQNTTYLSSNQNFNSFSLNNDFTSFKNSEKEADDLPKKYRGIMLAFGSRGIASTAGTITTSFVDDSPSMDSFSAVEEIDSYQNRFGLQIGYHFGRYSGLSHSVFFDAAFGNTESYLIGYSLGYNIPVSLGNGYLHIRPAFGLLAGNTRIKLGQIQNNASYIQINETQFYDAEVNVKLNSDNFIYRPHLDLMYSVADRFHIYANVGWDIGQQFNDPEVWFESPASSNESLKAEKPIDTENPSINFNGDVIKELPFELNGLRVNVGVAYVWGKG